MKIKCKVCRKEIEINELDYEAGDIISMECPRCGNELEAIVPLQNKEIEDNPKIIVKKSVDENYKKSAGSLTVDELKSIWNGGGGVKEKESIQDDNSKANIEDSPTREYHDANSSKSNNINKVSHTYSSNRGEIGKNITTQSEKKGFPFAKFLLLGIGFLIAAGIWIWSSKGRSESNTAPILVEHPEIVSAPVEERVDLFSDLLNHPERELRWEDIKDLDKNQLRILRNSYFARHGYIFNDPELTKFFSQFDWYHPYTKDVIQNFSKIEKSNVELIKGYEGI